MSRRRSTSRNSGNFVSYLIVFAILALVIVLILEYMDHRKGRDTFLLSHILEQKIQKKAPPRISTADSFHDKLIAAMDASGIPYNLVRDSRQRYHFKFHAKDRQRKSLVKTLKSLSGAHHLKWKTEEIQHLGNEQLYLYSISGHGKITTHLFLITIGKPAATSPRPEAADIRGHLAIIIDDIGYNELGALELKKLDIPITAAIIPEATYAYDEARQLHMYGLEQIIHLPMQSRNPKMQTNPSHFVMKGADTQRIRNLIRRAKTRVPYAMGANNHMGSLTTCDRDTMRRVLTVLKEEGLFFVDSRTSAETIAYTMARSMKIPTAQRDTFLEDINNGNITYQFTRNQILKVAKKARQRGHALAIGHPYPTTLKAIRDSIPAVRAMGVQFVPVSRLLER